MSDKLAKPPATPQQKMARFVDALAPKMAAVATAHMQPERLARVFLAACAKDSKLLSCSQNSIAVALLLCSQLGLEPNTPLGQVYLIPYGNELQCQLGYKGLLELVRRTGEVKRINAQCFHRQEIESGAVQVSIEPPEITHAWSGEEYSDQDIAGAYCTITMGDGTVYQEIMGRGELDKIARLGNQNSPAWKNHRSRMYRKAVIKRLINGGSVPISMEKLSESRLAHAIEADADTAEYELRPTTRAAGAMDAMAQQVEAQASAREPAPLPPPAPATPASRQRRGPAITEASMQACGPDSPAARVAAERNLLGVKMVQLRQFANGVDPASWDDDFAGRLIASMRLEHNRREGKQETAAEPPAKPEAPSAEPEDPQEGQPGMEPRPMHNWDEFRAAMNDNGLDWGEVDMLAEDMSLPPGHDNWTATALTNIWAELCERNRHG